MILKKPYAFFIKMFKPIHFVLAILVGYLIYLESNILSFLNDYLYSSTTSLITNNSFISVLLYIIPIIIIVMCIIILTVMFKKNKPITFYFASVFSFIVVIVINAYAINFIEVLSKSVVAIRSVKLIHDLVFIGIAIESISFLFLIIRGMGLDFKKFDFNSEISRFDIDEKDKEEFELNINLDINESKRKRRKRLRFLKYKYLENKLKINILFMLILTVTFVSIVVVFASFTSRSDEGKVYNANGFNFVINSTTILNTDYKGNKLTDNYLVVVNVGMMSNFSKKSLYLNDFSLKIGDAVFKSTKEYSNSLSDIGITYDESVLSNEYFNYIFVYEIPEKYKNSSMSFRYNNSGNIIKANLSPKSISNKKTNESSKIGKSIRINENIGDITFKINNYEIKNKYLIKYNYCISSDDCVLSYEYLTPTLNTNFDKYILKLYIDYSSSSKLSFYQLVSKYGSIHYKIDDEWYIQSGEFEEIKSKKVSDGATYIGINSQISEAEEIKLIFDIRNSQYEYVIK